MKGILWRIYKKKNSLRNSEIEFILRGKHQERTEVNNFNKPPRLRVYNQNESISDLSWTFRARMAMSLVLGLPPKGHCRVRTVRTVMASLQIRDFQIKGMI